MLEKQSTVRESESSAGRAWGGEHPVGPCLLSRTWITRIMDCSDADADANATSPGEDKPSASVRGRVQVFVPPTPRPRPQLPLSPSLASSALPANRAPSPPLPACCVLRVRVAAAYRADLSSSSARLSSGSLLPVHGPRLSPLCFSLPWLSPPRALPLPISPLLPLALQIHPLSSPSRAT